MNLLDAASRVAFAALIHDLGKFAQRADDPRSSRFSPELLDGNRQTYCPWWEKGAHFSHHHAAYTALAFDELEAKWPDVLRGDMFPFASRGAAGENKADSLINAAAAHHKPGSFLQWIVAAADRIASGFEREEFEKYNAAEDKTDTGRNHYQARLLPLLEGISIDGASGKRTAADYTFRQPLRPMSADGIFPAEHASCEPNNNAEAQAQYRALWEAFIAGLEKIPSSHRKSWSLWLDHFDSLWLAFTHAIPSATAFGVKPDVSLYDHSKATAALAVALWRYAHDTAAAGEAAARAIRDRADWDERKFLLVQGDFFGIQDFIFAEGGQTNRQAAKILRGRSFQVSLLVELAALRVLELLELPCTSRILNAAGKFLIVAPNTPDAVAKLRQAEQECDRWFLRHSFGQAGIGLVWEAASCNDFCGRREGASSYAELLQRLFAGLETAKRRRYALCSAATCGPVLDADFSQGVCAWQGKLPADGAGGDDAEQSCALSRDQIMIGENLVASSRILIVREDAAARLGGQGCELPVFGYKIMFVEDEAVRGRFGELAASGALRRCWDFSLPEKPDEVLWKGYARRQINGYAPRFPQDVPDAPEDKYGVNDAPAIVAGGMKTFNHIAREDRALQDGVWKGQAALTVLKGDVDDLGRIFQKGLNNPKAGQYPTFAKTAALSRRMNDFFAVHLPFLCARQYPDTYTVFAGGDDFFLIGPWLSTQKLAGRMAEDFARYAANNPHMHFSAGMVMHKPGAPVRALAETAEAALARAKKMPDKNAFCLFDVAVAWKDAEALNHAHAAIERVKGHYRLSAGFVYGLLHLLNMKCEESANKPEAALWRSRLRYLTARALERARLPDGVDKRVAAHDIVKTLGAEGIDRLGAAFRIPLFNYLYQHRD
jgi:CRISPR-associated protein Csm1